MIIDIIAIIIAALSLIISIFVAISQHNQQKNIHQASLNAKYHEIIFIQHLIHDIPDTRKYIRFDETGRLTDTEKFTTELNTMLSGALYYKYKDYAFYKKMKKSIEELEDYVMGCGNKTHEQEEQAEVYKVISEKLEIVYKIINDQYLGKK